MSVDSHFFDELGANSLLMARFNAALRERTALPSVSMKDIYLYPTVRELAASLGPATLRRRPGAAQAQPAMRDNPYQPLPQPARQPSGTSHYFLCGVLQLLTAAASIAGGALLLNAGFSWALGARGVLDAYRGSWHSAAPPCSASASSRSWSSGCSSAGGSHRASGPGASATSGSGWSRPWSVPIRWPTCSSGRRCTTLYLRALGARIGRGAAILTQHIPVCTDLLTIGAGSVITKDTYISCYRARAGLIETGHVTVGAGSFIGEHSVIDINTVLGEGAQLGHASALLTGQLVPPAEIWHGSPAERAPDGTVYQVVPPARCGVLRRTWSCVARLLVMLAVAGPVEAALASLLVTHSRALPALAREPTGDQLAVLPGRG